MRFFAVLPIIILAACEPQRPELETPTPVVDGVDANGDPLPPTPMAPTPPAGLPRLAPDHFPDGLPEVYDLDVERGNCTDAQAVLVQQRGRLWAEGDQWVLELVEINEPTARGVEQELEPCQLVMSGFPDVEVESDRLVVDVDLGTDLQATTCGEPLPGIAMQFDVLLGPSGSAEWTNYDFHWAFGFASGWEVSFEREPECF